jgi:uncharacterized membrane protein
MEHRLKAGRIGVLVKFIVIILLAIGILLRFTNLDQKAFWRDEVFNSFMISGYNQQKVIEQLGDGRIITIDDLQKYQTPNQEKNLKAMVINKAQSDPQHPPLYYILARYWAIIFGNSPTSMRGFSAFVSLLIFPAFYWLCLELFENKSVGWFAIALTSVSLFHVMYAQEARPYSLWTVTTLLSSAAILKAIKFKDSLICWGIYVITAVAGIYTFPFTVFTLIGQGIYLLVIEGFHFNKTVKYFLICCFLIILCFLPWVFAIFQYTTPENNAASSWLKGEYQLSYLVQGWFLNISYIFLSAKPRVSIFIIALVIYSIYYVFRETSKRVWLFIFSITFSLAIPFALVDLFLGYRITTVTRYMIPVYLGIQLAVTYLFADQILLKSSNKLWQKRVWLMIMTITIALGLWSCLRFINADRGWNKGNLENIPLAEIINQYSSPLIIVEGEANKLSNLISLSYMLESKARFQLITKPEQLLIDNNFTDLFLLYSSSELLRLVENQGYIIDETYPKLPLVKIKFDDLHD